MPAPQEGRVKLVRLIASLGDAAAPLAAGDRPSPFSLPDDRGNDVSPWSIRDVGTPIVFALGGSVREQVFLDELRAFRDTYPALEAMHCRLFAVTRDAIAVNHDARAKQRFPFPILSDPAGRVRDAYGFGAQGAPVTVLLDRNCRVSGVVDGSVNARHAMRVLRFLEDAARVGPAARLSSHAPVLIVPRVLSREDCAILIRHWRKPAPEWQPDQVTHACAGHQVETGEFRLRATQPGRVARMVVRDATLQARLDSRLARRLIAEIETAFQTSITYRDTYRIAGYDAEDDGGLPPHRDDDTDPPTHHRRFTVSIALNQGDFDGGELRFREYGDALYEIETGAAIVWSAALLQEVLPVTTGQRFILSTSLSGT